MLKVKKQFEKVSFFRGALRISTTNNHNDGLWINSAKSKSTNKIQENYTLEMLCVECTVKKRNIAASFMKNRKSSDYMNFKRNLAW